MNQITSLYTQCVISPSFSIKEALARINALRGVPLTLFVTDSSSRLLGTLTDGDIRRGLLSGASLDDSVEMVMQRNFHAFRPTLNDAETMADARRLGLLLMPRLDSAGALREIIDLRTRRAILPLDAVLMAGGRGERLRPLTLSTPKPLLPVGGKPIIDRNVDALAACGVKHIYVTVNYLREMIEAHFAPERPDGISVTCIREPRPLGTFGSIGLIPSLLTDDVLIMNSDLLTDIDFSEMYQRHLATKADMTIAAIPYTVSVPYAILETSGGLCTALQEKPTYNYLANAGVYIVKRSRLTAITGEERVDATDFIDSLLASPDARVATYPIDGTWIDIGSPSDYRAACDRFPS